MKVRLTSLVVFIAGTLLLSPARACTTFCGGELTAPLIGKSYDWHMGQGLVLYNKQGVAKRSIPGQRGDQPASWVSKYASLTFNQYGAEFPNGGMNTAGLTVEIMWLNGSVYPQVDARPALTELQWIQYQLDNFATTAQIVEAAPKLRVSPAYAKVHYLACDKSGACAAFEYLDGALVISAGKTLPSRTLTNHDYARSHRHLRQHVGFGGTKALPGGSGSLARFVRAASKSSAAKSTEDAFKVLDAVSQGDYTKWNIVYSPVRRELWWRTSASRTIKHVDLKGFDPSCKTPTLVLDIDDKAAGDAMKRFVPLDTNRNIALLRKSIGPIIEQLPKGSFADLATYNTKLKCVRP